MSSSFSSEFNSRRRNRRVFSGKVNQQVQGASMATRPRKKPTGDYCRKAAGKAQDVRSARNLNEEFR